MPKPPLTADDDTMEVFRGIGAFYAGQLSSQLRIRTPSQLRAKARRLHPAEFARQILIPGCKNKRAGQQLGRRGYHVPLCNAYMVDTLLSHVAAMGIYSDRDCEVARDWVNEAQTWLESHGGGRGGEEQN